MAQYYGIERSSEYLEHYGIKGMRWGVRKAIQSGDRQALKKHFVKASLKLGKLSLNANRPVQQRLYNSAKSRMVSGALGSALGSAGLTAAINGDLKSAGIAGAAGLVGGALLNSRGITAKRHLSDRGHAKAIEKRNQFAREMESAFSDSATWKKNRKELHKHIQQVSGLSDAADPRRYVAKQYNKATREAMGAAKKRVDQIKRNERANQTLRTGLKAGVIGTVGGAYAANSYTARKIAEREKPSKSDQKAFRQIGAIVDREQLARPKKRRNR